MNDEAFVKWLADDGGFRDVRLIAPHRWAAVMTYMFTFGICVGRVGDFYGFDDRWCYHDYHVAKAALEAWDGVGEPQGWHRHPATGRRVSPEGAQYVML